MWPDRVPGTDNAKPTISLLLKAPITCPPTFSATTNMLIFISVALAIVAVGVALSLFGPIDPTTPSTTRPPRRRTRSEVLAAVATIATIPGAMGVFGVFGRLIDRMGAKVDRFGDSTGRLKGIDDPDFAGAA